MRFCGLTFGVDPLPVFRPTVNTAVSSPAASLLSPPDERHLTMTPATNLSTGGAPEEKPCIVNDQMGPFTVVYILIFIISLPGNLVSVWAFIRSPRAKVGGTTRDDRRMSCGEVSHDSVKVLEEHVLDKRRRSDVRICGQLW